MNVLVTGGAGYIGSHAVKRLVQDGHHVVVVDNLGRGNIAAVPDGVPLVVHDLSDWHQIAHVLECNKIECVMHFAALAYVGESVNEPLWYYRNNTAHAIALLHAMDQTGVRKMVFSSTCATFGEPPADFIPINEDCPQNPINPYGRSKLVVEHVMQDYADAQDEFAYAMLRYFNVAGSDRDCEIGEAHDPETHLIPIILQAALGHRSEIKIFGTDYDTPDGTCIRDYVHVEDLIGAHVLAMDKLQAGKPLVYNLGIGRGYSVREIVESAKRVTGRNFKVVEGERRPGDPPTLYADSTKIKTELGWQPAYTDIDAIVATAWDWFSKHPNGYESNVPHINLSA